MIPILVLLLRVGLGLVFAFAGGLKIGHFDIFASEIAGFELLPQALVAPLALLLPFVEVLLGMYLILGLFTRLAAGLATLQLLIFSGAIASAVVRGISASCGCFGPSDHSTTSWPEVGRDLALAAVAAFVAWRAPAGRSRSIDEWSTGMSKAAQHPAKISRSTILYATLAVVAIAAIVAVALANRVPKAATTVNPNASLAVGQTAPEFSVTTDAGPFDLANVSQPVFLEIFATWCPHCQHEVPIIDGVAKKYSGKVAFVGVTGSPYGIDGSSPENQSDVQEWVQKLGVTYPVAYDPGLTVANQYLQSGYPTIAIIGADKKIHYLSSGEVTAETLEKAINQVVGS